MCCKEYKPLSDFCKTSLNLDGLSYYCRNCRKLKHIQYDRTKVGLLNKIYNNQKLRTTRRNYPLPTYTREELKEWLFSQDLFHELYDKWVESNYDRWLIPSIDRIDDYKYYSLDNIQITTWKENDFKHRMDRRNGINNKHSKAVIQYDLEGNIIARYPSSRYAGRETGLWQSGIAKACREHRIYKGYIWKYDCSD